MNNEDSQRPKFEPLKQAVEAGILGGKKDGGARKGRCIHGGYTNIKKLFFAKFLYETGRLSDFYKSTAQQYEIESEMSDTESNSFARLFLPVSKSNEAGRKGRKRWQEVQRNEALIRANMIDGNH